MGSRTFKNARSVRWKDQFRAATVGLRKRPLRSFLATLGVSVGIAAIIAIINLSSSGQENAVREVQALGVDTLLIEPGISVDDSSKLPPDAAQSLEFRIPAVVAAAAVRDVDARLRRSSRIPETNTEGVVVQALEPEDLDLLETVHGSVAEGRFLRESDLDLPMIVIGSVTAERLGVGPDGALVDISGEPFRVVGVLEDFERINTNFNTVALMGKEVAARHFDVDDEPSSVYARTDERFLSDVREVVPAQVAPTKPASVAVSRPSDAVLVREILDRTLRNLLIGMGVVGALVGAIGIANVMIVSVVERTGEVGLRRALGARRVDIGFQFLLESFLLAELGGLLGVLLGVLGGAIYATLQGWPVVVSMLSLVPVLGFAGLVGAIAGLYPALKAASLSPVEALRSGT